MSLYNNGMLVNFSYLKLFWAYVSMKFVKFSLLQCFYIQIDFAKKGVTNYKLKNIKQALL